MRKQILVVEDNSVNMELVTDLLESHGYAVLQAYSAEEALSLARDKRPALILMDISLPGMDGLEAIKRLKADPKTRDMPVVCLTAHAMSGDEERALQAGANGYFTKPIDTRELPRRLKQYLAPGVEAEVPANGQGGVE